MGLKKRIERTMFYGAKPEIFENARLLRENMTECEKLLWQHLRNNRLDGFRFKAQHPVLKFVADFYCHQLKLAIEIDGEYHLTNDQKNYDQQRDYEFENLGIKMLRFTNKLVKNEIEFVLDEIKKACKAAIASPSDSPQREPPANKERAGLPLQGAGGWRCAGGSSGSTKTTPWN